MAFAYDEVKYAVLGIRWSLLNLDVGYAPVLTLGLTSEYTNEINGHTNRATGSYACRVSE